MHAVDLVDGDPEPGGGDVQIHTDDPTGRDLRNGWTEPDWTGTAGSVDKRKSIDVP
ncbi:hypothetical protein Voc01_057700 [Virgisporangium ochraceum]|uniref:Uncharacterized protein n=1 Tax=Virgisporangium ochraceum TaxID=65505 RepID=A0A8J3ZZ22_9ACTN|nr:hypothetical protein Voc01_057700 [Virgisporangium ochraceum]